MLQLHYYYKSYKGTSLLSPFLFFSASTVFLVAFEKHHSDTSFSSASAYFAWFLMGAIVVNLILGSRKHLFDDIVKDATALLIPTLLSSASFLNWPIVFFGGNASPAAVDFPDWPLPVVNATYHPGIDVFMAAVMALVSVILAASIFQRGSFLVALKSGIKVGFFLSLLWLLILSVFCQTSPLESTVLLTEPHKLLGIFHATWNMADYLRLALPFLLIVFFGAICLFLDKRNCS